MKVGFNLLLWTATVTEEHFGLLEDIKKWGADGVELPMFATDTSPWTKLSKHLDGLGMGRTVVSVLPPGTNMIGEDAAERTAAVEFMKAAIDKTHELGAETIAGPYYSPVGRHTGVRPTDQERGWAVEGLRAIGEHAEGSGIKLAVEPLNRFETYFLNTQEQCVEVLKQVNHPQVGILYDTFHANIEEKKTYEAILTGGKYINHVHISANDRGTPGEDHVDYATNIKGLKAIGYDGWLTIETFGSRLPELAAATCIWRTLSPSEEHTVREGVAFTKKIWQG